MKPSDKKESMLQMRYEYPHDVFNNHDQGVRIAHRRWKRKMHKLNRKQGKEVIKKELSEV